MGNETVPKEGLYLSLVMHEGPKGAATTQLTTQLDSGHEEHEIWSLRVPM
jgi:hypothetical protein